MSQYIDVPLHESESQTRGMFPVEHMHILENKKEDKVFITYDYDTYICVDMNYDSIVRLISDKKKVAKGKRRRRPAKEPSPEQRLKVL